MTRLLFTMLEDEPANAASEEHLSNLRRECIAVGAGDLVFASTPEEAGLIVLFESRDFKGASYIQRLQQSALLANFAEKVVTLNYEDGPSGALSGLYTSLSKKQYRPEIHRSWPYICLPNEKVHGRAVTDIDSAKLLFSFRGNFTSHSIRSELGRLYGNGDGSVTKPYEVVSVNRWYNHNADEKKTYLDHIENSVFGLCPRGIAPYTHRIAEVMALGRVPVIISDDWVPFDFEEKDSYYIQIAEADVTRIADILKERRGEARMLSANGRKLFERYLTIENRIPQALRMMQIIQANRRADWVKRFYTDRWTSQQFRLVNGWTMTQRLTRKLGRLISR